MELSLIKTELLDKYLPAIPAGLQEAFDALHDAAISAPNFSFYASVASVFSSKIEGENIELDSYIKYKRDGIPFLPDYTKKIDDLYNAYRFAGENELNIKNIAAAHKLLGKHILRKVWLGKFRNQMMYVTNDEGRIEYVAAAPDAVPAEMKKLCNDIAKLLGETLSVEEGFFYAAMIHLVFVKIHPWTDGNGRSARLLEKWFLAEKLGPKAWFLASEKHYYRNHEIYYKNIRALGTEYDTLDFSKALSFLLMLPDAVIFK